MMHLAPQTLPSAHYSRGFTLLIALIFTSVVLSVGLALLDITYKQVILSSTSRQSEYAFYAADSAMECALFADSKLDTFDYTNEPAGNPVTTGSITCEGQTFSFYAGLPVASSRTTTFDIPCAGGGTQASVTVYKQSTGGTTIFANGFNTCDTSNPQRIERGLQTTY